MKLNSAFWVHGNAVRSEGSGLWLDEMHYGDGTHFKTALGPEDPANPFAHTMWFHIPITTPVVIDGVRPMLSRVFLCYKTIGQTKLKALYVYDGSVKVGRWDGMSRQGDHPQTSMDVDNTWTLNPLTIYFGLSISANVWFGLDDGGVIPEFVFYTAGADFSTP